MPVGTIASVSAGYGGLKAAFDIAKGLDSLKTAVAVNQAKIDLQQHIAEAQQALLEAQEAKAASAQRIRELEQQLVELENWEAEKQRYELADAGQGTVAYRPKADMKGDEPDHWLCAQCFQQGKKSYLQPEMRFPGRNSYLCCSSCKAEMIIHGDRTIEQRPRR